MNSNEKKDIRNAIKKIEEGHYNVAVAILEDIVNDFDILNHAEAIKAYCKSRDCGDCVFEKKISPLVNDCFFARPCPENWEVGSNNE